jgi:DNA polymerase-3 subunit epsilon
VHGYTNEMVADKPTFREKAKEIALFIGNADLAGYNILKFDLPMLVEEFLRVDYDFDLKDRGFIDVMNIYMKMEPRTLKSAYRYFCHAELEGAHGAMADTKATYDVLRAMLDKYQGVDFEDGKGNKSQGPTNDMKQLSEFSAHHKNADLSGQIIFDEEGKEVFMFGKHKGKRVEDVFRIEPPYYDWIMKNDFPRYTKKVVTAIKLRMGGKTIKH